MTETVTTAEQLNDLRQRYLAGKPWSREELKRTIDFMIGDRLRAVQEGVTKTTKKAKPVPVSLDSFLDPVVAPRTVSPDTKPEAPPPPVPSKKPDTSGFF